MCGLAAYMCVCVRRLACVCSCSLAALAAVIIALFQT